MLINIASLHHSHNKAVNAGVLFVRYAHYKCAGYGKRYAATQIIP